MTLKLYSRSPCTLRETSACGMLL